MNVIITGASKGIGKAIAEIFAANGHHLFLCARGEVVLYKTLEELVTKYPSAIIKAKPFDLSRKEEAKAFGAWCLEYGVPDVLVNNAGFFEPGSVHNEPDGTLESQLAVNLHSAYHVTRAVLPWMMEKRSGHVFNMCSIASLDAYANGGAYSISKFALYGFSKNLRQEMKPHGIKVTSIHPGAVMSDSWGKYDNSSKRIMEAEDIAKMIYAATQLSVQACVEDIVIRPQLGDL
ncbi:MAG: SDR family oxidoreductase [Chitinophagaceae bacterium]|jgi:short-subunit dehydrogenase|nr:SDR family oxidoreductase [Chitinophagaceae bacterium]MBK7678378.1 SDR family oxidoreductase [Chitinophagaceae bacterium]MBK8300263.1 SDR family oxidoreductase [Chitinophagaceae bacterium]MBK9464307.1 SDR family oxidoreductase [Chitinophagaceae bacterium]MBK9658569.1 SDR family oxidoreductase [Chitinophagaceae bacterium]